MLILLSSSRCKILKTKRKTNEKDTWELTEDNEDLKNTIGALNGWVKDEISFPWGWSWSLSPV